MRSDFFMMKMGVDRVEKVFRILTAWKMKLFFSPVEWAQRL